MPLQVSLNLAKTLCAHVLRARLTESPGNTNERDWEAWRQGLSSWRELMVAAQVGGEAGGMLLDEGMWDAAMRCVGGWKHSDNKRTGDWNELPDVLRPELVAWQEAGLLESVPASSTEWPAVALATLARRHALVPTDLAERMGRAFLVDAPSVCAALLSLDHALDVDDVMGRPRAAYDAKPLAHLLFHPENMASSRVLAPRLTAQATRITDKEGRTPLFEAGWRPEQALALLDLGADPHARDHEGLLAEEASWSASATGVSTHALLQARRTHDQAREAHNQFLAASLTRTSHAQLQELGLWEETLSINARYGGAAYGPVGYMLARSRAGRGSTEEMTVLARLASGRRGLEVLAREGSLELGLARALALAGGVSPGDWSKRCEAVQRGLATAARQADLPRVFEHLFTCHQVETPEALSRAAYLLSTQEWGVAPDRIFPVLQRMSERLVHWSRPPDQASDTRPFVQVLDRLEDAVKAFGEPCQATRQAWLPAMFLLSVAVPGTHPACLRMTNWLAEGDVPAWPSEAVRQQAEKWTRGRHPELWAAADAAILDEALGAGQQRPVRPRM